MDEKAMFKKAAEIENELNRLTQTKEDLRKQWRELRDNLATAWGERYTGLKVGDVIEYTKTTWRKTQTLRMKITGFDVYLRTDKEYREDKRPVIKGVTVLKNGEAGTRPVSIYDHENTNPVKVG